MISFYSRGRVWPESRYFCDLWQVIDYIFTACTAWSQAIFTIERYVLIFSAQHLRSQRQKFIFHYIPILLTHIYLILFYTLNRYINNCQSNFEFDKHLCGLLCLDQGGVMTSFNWLFNILLPVFIIISGSSLLLVRVLWMRRDMQRNLRNWSKNRKMIGQLLGIAIVYSIVWLPLSIISTMVTFGYISPEVEVLNEQLYILTYLNTMGIPIVAIFVSPELKLRFRPCRQSNVAGQVSATITLHRAHR
jgi:hypothetical protein